MASSSATPTGAHLLDSQPKGCLFFQHHSACAPSSLCAYRHRDAGAHALLRLYVHQVTLHEALPSLTDAGAPARSVYTFAQHQRHSNRSMLQEARMPFAGLITPEGFHEPLRWTAKDPHRDVGGVVAIFRRPMQRLLSARSYMRRHRHCCGADWGLTRKRREQARAAASARTFALLPGMRGCQTKMVLGYRCCDVAGGLIAGRIPRAVEFIERRMAFVGLLEQWERSVCLFHARFGGPLFAAELMDMRPTASASGGSATQYNESELDGVVDEADQAVYEAAVRRFERDVGEHAADVAHCLHHIRAAVARGGLPAPSFTEWAKNEHQRLRSFRIVPRVTRSSS